MLTIQHICLLDSWFTFMGFFGMFFHLIFFSLIFNYKVIPRIEKRLSEKLEFKYFPGYYLFPKFMHPLGYWADIGGYIVWSYLWHVPKKREGQYALHYINYNIKDASRFEIVMSFLAIFTCIMVFVLLGISYYIDYAYSVCK